MVKISKIKKIDVIEYLHLDEDMYPKGSNAERNLFAAMDAAYSYILDYTGLTKEEADTHEQFYTAYMVLCQDMYDNRAYYVEKGNVNKVVDSILGMHCKNLL